ncbi:thioredoxin family protein [Domibacillus sp. DTU_2020_1001157_1_SI_ALB_TIR_016]|uniref:thioredoxin family protein n=1 Tax=Domibacillus sp. DTU_2020_1001157_1_SI_ALB_TIR_016 TaxID=3077789 RepID=UPI0028E73661|nr:thioredoxin family protein [Domibacillus sp. DTU_2020_1001157_1_SI_ALB_TIR_016]WNS82478.1 thioredoxin family protein [Domibacillus sp. DTU_2020_1001157_1_SI_ALB_TIR_016]
MEKLQSLDQFEQLKKEERVVFMFSADWCPDCRVIEPILPGIEADYPEYQFIYVDRDEFIDLCGELSVFGIPSFVAYHSGEEAGRFVSKDRKTQEEIEAFLNSLSA